MARKQVEEVQCERCPRVEYRATDPNREGFVAALSPELHVSQHGATVASFQDLCGPCAKAVAVHLDAISKKMDQVSPDRQKA